MLPVPVPGMSDHETVLFGVNVEAHAPQNVTKHTCIIAENLVKFLAKILATENIVDAIIIMIDFYNAYI